MTSGQAGGPHPRLEVDVDRRGTEVVVRVVGEVDLGTSPVLARRLDAELAAGPAHLAVDLSRTGFLDSAGLGVLVGVRRRALAADVALTLVRPHPHVAAVLRVSGLDRVFTVVTDEAGPPGRS